eukprot:TRINITY_DN4263_c1_g1_i1.p1 TRINITY_DN4263_c1_g1~~TRINITY_DN4263_c1_g1_i1.p1  ORF type:complete len:332 (+),score=42.84 TRINITY_DN4263_c1_g1_i1:250-1245(+)
MKFVTIFFNEYGSFVQFEKKKTVTASPHRRHSGFHGVKIHKNLKQTFFFFAFYHSFFNPFNLFLSSTTHILQFVFQIRFFYNKMMYLVAVLFYVAVGRELSYFSSDITDSDLDFPQAVRGQEGYAALGTVETGNQFTVGAIDFREGSAPGVFGVGIGQYSGSNNATAGNIANSGNINIGDLDYADVKVEGTAQNNFAFGGTQGAYAVNSGNNITFGNLDDNSILDINTTAKYNYAYSQQGNANAGNEVTVGNTGDSDFILDQTAMYNTAISVDGDANAGNILNVGSLGDGEFNVNQYILGNTATSENGNANIGNQVNFAGLRRKLMKSDEY